MGKAEAGSTKAAANAIKAKGLGRLRWYCQVCEKQCRDENGFQAHCRAESHLRRILQLGPKAGSAIADFSNQFQSEFMTLLRTRHLTNRVQANKVYNEYIQDKHHIHMNSTRWVTLAGFVMTIGKAGLVRVEEDEKGLWITWVDNRPETLSKQAALQKRDRATMDGEERERLALQDQIARAKAQEALRIAEAGPVEAALQKKEGEKITLSFQPVAVASTSSVPASAGESSTSATAAESSTSGDATPSTAAPASTSLSFGSLSSTPSLPKPVTNTLKRPASTNVFKSAKAPKVAKTEDGETSTAGAGGKKYTSEAERLMKEDQARKAARGGSGGGSGGGGGYGGFGPVRTNKPSLGRTY